MLTQEALQAWYGSHEADLDWLDKPSRHQFRWRLPNDRWATANRQFSSPKALQKELQKQGPRDVYVGTSAWLTPIDLPKRSDTDAPHPVLIDHMVVFDIDFTPFSYRRLEQARKASHRLLTWLDENEDLTLRSISYSGGKGFHLVFADNDRSLFSIPDPKEREEAVRAGRQALLQRVLDQGFPVDTTVTADTRRIIRLPGSLHGTTGWVCSRITREQLAKPLKSWVKTLEKHPLAKPLRYWPYGPSDVLHWFKPKSSKQATSANVKPNHQTAPLTVLQCSTQVVGTKGRSALMAWIPQRWKDGHLEAVAQRVEELGWGPVHQFEHLGQTLLIAPRAIPKEQLTKELATMGWPSLSSELKQMGHVWLDIHPLLDDEVAGEHLLSHRGVWHETGPGGKTTPYSATHLELIQRLGVEIDVGEHEVAGRREPALRVVTKT